MSNLDKDYIDSVVEIALQDVRHYLEPLDTSAAKAIRESLDRIEGSNESHSALYQSTPNGYVKL